ncbi:hypothetical protein MTR62_15165 [Novosphingobium sp. 1949]|uniref:Uncharacterized protein n=1 Tax=Novosphingobium organovorum TaxID=2930092 RepID=A0ABT0BG58_9SPHN|nr:hypothetical protein [Novosphingobium organovorum]MCJ2184024.1 hypothetical protein [Novosphingobium organovorum]
MRQKYHDIIRNIPHPPIWWFEGIPRYEAFSPAIIGTFEIALVHTECRSCRTRYDIAIKPQPPLYHSLRNILAYTNALEVGDPPFACDELGAQCNMGYAMSSLEFKILEFWCRSDVRSEWQRISHLEQPLVDANWDGENANILPDPIFLRIANSDRNAEWRNARQQGQFSQMIEILREFGCERPIEVANMLDLDRREKSLMRELRELHQIRLRGSVS